MTNFAGFTLTAPRYFLSVSTFTSGRGIYYGSYRLIETLKCWNHSSILTNGHRFSRKQFSQWGQK